MDLHLEKYLNTLFESRKGPESRMSGNDSVNLKISRCKSWFFKNPGFYFSRYPTSTTYRSCFLCGKYVDTFWWVQFSLYTNTIRILYSAAPVSEYCSTTLCIRLRTVLEALMYWKWNTYGVCRVSDAKFCRKHLALKSSFTYGVLKPTTISHRSWSPTPHPNLLATFPGGRRS